MMDIQLREVRRYLMREFIFLSITESVGELDQVHTFHVYFDTGSAMLRVSYDWLADHTSDLVAHRLNEWGIAPLMKQDPAQGVLIAPNGFSRFPRT